MNETKSMKFKFFQVIVHPDKEAKDGKGAKFDALLRAIGQKATPEQRAFKLRDIDFRMDSFIEEKGFIAGDMVRTRTGAIPGKFRRNSPMEDIPLAPDEEIGEETAFLYHVQTQALVMQRNFQWCTESIFAAYVMRASQTELLEIVPVLRQDALARLRTAKEFHTLKYKLARANSGLSTASARQAETDVKAWEIAQHSRASTIEVSVSMGHSDGSLASTMREVKKLREAADAGEEFTLKKLSVRARLEDDGPLEFIDLLEAQVEHVEMVTFEKKKRIPFATRYAALKDAYRAQKAALAAVLTSE